jgi:anti-sigma factor RsiW
VMMAAALAASAGLGFWASRQFRDGDNLQHLADEIAYNHLVAKPLDVTGGSMDALRPAFRPLGFSLAEDPRLDAVRGRLVGGRFCSVASVPAALLRYESETSATTVYQALYDNQRHRDVPDSDSGQPPAERHARGVRVQLWQRSGLLVAVAATDDRT